MNKTFIQSYIMKLLSNIINVSVSAFVIVFLARKLGPDGYGTFGYLNILFQNAFILFFLNSPNAYFKYTAQFKGRLDYTRTYAKFSLFAILGLYATMIITLTSPLRNSLFPGIESTLIFAASFFALQTWLIKLSTEYADALKKTVSIQFAVIIYKLLFIGLIIVLYTTNRLSIVNYYLYGGILGIVLFLYHLAFFKKHKIYNNLDSSRSSIEIFHEYFLYTKPLIVLAFLGVFYNTFSRILVQHLYGSFEQGIYHYSYRVSSLIIILSTSMSTLLFQRVVESPSIGKKIDALFSAMHVIIILIATLVSLIIFQTDAFIYYTAGTEYIAAKPVISILLIFSVFQSIGHLLTVFMYGIGNTKALARISGTVIILSSLSQYVLLFHGRDIIKANGVFYLALIILVSQIASISALFVYIYKQYVSVSLYMIARPYLAIISVLIYAKAVHTAFTLVLSFGLLFNILYSISLLTSIALYLLYTNRKALNII
jgi:O-antigen/teichoic acid export membrane protein